MQYHAVPYDAMRYNGIICIFGPKKGHFRQLGPRNGTPSGQTATFRKTEGIQSYLRICGCYDLIKSGLSEPKKRDFMGVAQKNLIFGLFLGQKWALAAPQELAQQHERHKNVVFLVSGHDGNKEIGGCAQKNDFRPKNSIFGPKKGHFGQSVPKNGPPSGQTATYRKIEGIQSYLRICGCYDLIKSGSSEPKKRDFIGVA